MIEEGASVIIRVFTVDAAEHNYSKSPALEWYFKSKECDKKFFDKLNFEPFALNYYVDAPFIRTHKKRTLLYKILKIMRKINAVFHSERKY